MILIHERITLHQNYFRLKSCYFEAEGGINDLYCVHLVSAKLKININLVSAKLKININLSLRVGDGRNNFEFLLMTQSNFQSKVTPK